MTRIFDWLVAYLCRWLPRPTPTGLFRVGNPDENSPVIVTANFALTVERVKKALQGQNLWLLVANAEGINVWCAADGNIFTHNRIIDAVKVSGLADKVRHRELILPALGASGIDLEAIREETGFRGHFGPVYASDIPVYLRARKKKTEAMKHFNFGLKHRLDMFLSMNFPIYLVPALVLAIFWPHHLLGFTVLFWSALAFLYLFVDVIPGKTGWGQALLCATVLVVGWMTVDSFLRGDPFGHGGWLVATFAIFLAAGFDLAGTVSPRKSDAEQLVHRLGFKSLGFLLSEKEMGEIALDRERCNGCRACLDICPVGVYSDLDLAKKITFRDQQACFACSACVKQCPEDALALV